MIVLAEMLKVTENSIDFVHEEFAEAELVVVEVFYLLPHSKRDYSDYFYYFARTEVVEAALSSPYFQVYNFSNVLATDLAKTFVRNFRKAPVHSC